ncbi:hypothetical protein L2703_12375 [Shewanella basaltis]|uniref:hypothetical protein n=1 Tax=Shewanella basaltis TaxID=472183 RepID=UPI00200DF144|nr:hypothetical protein [Shewanella basaltis]MCL1114382.1 hypothetical protein [Shewanella basaltis]
MSFSLYLFAFNNHQVDHRYGNELASALSAHRDINTIEARRFEYQHEDGGRALFSIAADENVSSIDVTVFQMSKGLADYLFELQQQWQLVLINVQGDVKTSNKEAEHPTIFVLSQADLEHLPSDYHSPRCVLENNVMLYDYLSISFTAWQRYRDQVIGTGNSQFVDDSQCLFELIAAPLPLMLRQQLWAKIRPKLVEHGVEDAFHDVLSSLDAQLNGQKQWVWLQVDVRDHNEVLWQAKAIAKTIGLGEFIDDEHAKDDLMADSACLHALSGFDLWLSQFGRSFILVENGDTYFGFVVADDDVDNTLGLFKRLSLNGQAIRHIADDYVAAVKESLDEAKAMATEKGLISEFSTDYPILKQDTAQSGVMIVRVEASKTSLKNSVAEQANNALALGRIPLICLSAPWCEPCQDMLVVLHQQGAQTVMQKIAIILLDIEDWGGHLRSIDIQPSCIPVFFDVNVDGRAGNKSVDGNAWGEPADAIEIAGILRETFGLH